MSQEKTAAGVSLEEFHQRRNLQGQMKSTYAVTNKGNNLLADLIELQKRNRALKNNFMFDPK